jgi:hypothetical protein
MVTRTEGGRYILRTFGGWCYRPSWHNQVTFIRWLIPAKNKVLVSPYIRVVLDRYPYARLIDKRQKISKKSLAILTLLPASGRASWRAHMTLNGVPPPFTALIYGGRLSESTRRTSQFVWESTHQKIKPHVDPAWAAILKTRINASIPPSIIVGCDWWIPAFTGECSIQYESPVNAGIFPAEIHTDTGTQ